MSIRMNLILSAVIGCAIAIFPANSAAAEPPEVTVEEWPLDLPDVPRTLVPAPSASPPISAAPIAQAIDPYLSVTPAQLLAGLDGPQMRLDPSPEQFENARRIVEVVRQRHMPAIAAVIALATALQESTLRNLTEAVDYDSLGLFQQRPSAGWGRPEQLTDPVYATNTFLDVLERKVPDYASVPLWQAAQTTQGSAFPTAYARWQEQAAILTMRILLGQ